MKPRRISWDIMAGIINASEGGVSKSKIVNTMEINFTEANKFIEIGIRKSWLRRDGGKIFSTEAGKEFAFRVDFINGMWSEE